MSALSRRLEQAAATVRTLEKEHYLRRLTGGQLDSHIRLSWSGILEPVSPEMETRFREEEREAKQRQEYVKRGDVEKVRAACARWRALQWELRQNRREWGAMMAQWQQLSRNLERASGQGRK
jgi:hypothetical protein